MVTFLNGNTYKLVYLDTNSLNYIAKNTFETTKNFFLKYCLDGDYMFVTTSFNLFELFKTKYETRSSIIKFFNVFPLGILETYPQLIEFEKKIEGFHPDMIMFAMGIKGLFKTQIEDFMKAYDEGEFDKTISVMTNNFKEELVYWNSLEPNTQWMKNFNNSLMDSMNNLFKYSPNSFEIVEMGKYKSLEVYTFISNQFINSTNSKQEINSIIDAYNTSVLPYVEVYITEKTVGSWLEMAKDKFVYLKDKEIIKIGYLFNK
ncbi:MAG: hypothetical protein EOM50_02150 [Erysipelotrichia bacterium]|nr:hypothetical protein [Erysipelotrichia bacterium]